MNPIIDYTEFIDLPDRQIEITGKVFDKSIWPAQDVFTAIEIIEVKDGEKKQIGGLQNFNQLTKEKLIEAVKGVKSNHEPYLFKNNE